jgi:HK97 family phage prohead protease
MKTQPSMIRAYPSMIEQTGPRKLTGRLVPYNHPTDVADPIGNGEFELYREGFRPGAFSPQVNSTDHRAWNNIGLVHRHDGGLGYLGPFVALREEPDGLWGDVTILRSRANDVEDLLTAGVSELSVEFRLPRVDHTEVDDAGIRWRIRAHLDQVALEPKGAYATAQVTAFRAEADAIAQEQAEAAAAAASDEEAAAEEARRLEEATQAALQRRARWDELTARADKAIAEQTELLKRYGVTQQTGYQTLGGNL